MKFPTIYHLIQYLTDKGCTRCSLGFQEGLNGCCIARGNSTKKRMIIGEAPGRHENIQSRPFVGPAGQLWDKILASVGWSDDDWYITNIILCRPIAPRGSGKENYTPKVEQIKKCRPFLDEQIRLIDPEIIVTLGKPATETILEVKGIKMGDYRGTLIGHSYPSKTSIPPAYIFPMLHPAALLHAQSQPSKYQMYKEQMWEDIQKLKKTVEELKL